MGSAIPFVPDPDVRYGMATAETPLIRRIVANNPGPFTYTGTGTYIVGHGDVAVIDPGPAIPAHVDALLAALDGERVSHIVVTHTHLDHSPAAAALKQATGAATYGFGPHGSGRAAGLERETVEAGADWDFTPDVAMADGDALAGNGWTLEAIHTPGHTSNHLCFALAEEQALFTGDHVMGWSTTVVSPPDGDMAAYMASLERLLAREDASLWPTHGQPVTAPKPFLAALIDHRKGREEQILACLADGIAAIPDMVTRMYADVPTLLHPAAARSVLAHLIKMVDEGRVATDALATVDAVYRLG